MAGFVSFCPPTPAPTPAALPLLLQEPGLRGPSSLRPQPTLTSAEGRLRCWGRSWEWLRLQRGCIAVAAPGQGGPAGPSPLGAGVRGWAGAGRLVTRPLRPSGSSPSPAPCRPCMQRSFQQCLSGPGLNPPHRNAALKAQGWVYSLPTRRLLATQETQVRSLARGDPLEEGVATRSSVLGWRIPWTEEPGGLQSMGSQRVRHL